MKQIWKFQLNLQAIQDVMMPAGARLLSAQLQYDALCVWACADPTNDRANRRIGIVGTGHEFPYGDAPHIATVQQEAFVWHLFDLGETP